MTPDMSRYLRSTDSFSPLELASFFAQHRAAVDASLDWPSFCFFRVWLRFSAFLVRRSRVYPRLKTRLPPSAEVPSVTVPTFGAFKYFDKSLSFAAATESRTTPSAECPGAPGLSAERL
jgi:hypothetical protein